jgi:hypothetical protein
MPRACHTSHHGSSAFIFVVICETPANDITAENFKDSYIHEHIIVCPNSLKYTAESEVKHTSEGC